MLLREGRIGEKGGEGAYVLDDIEARGRVDKTMVRREEYHSLGVRRFYKARKVSDYY